MGCARLLLTLSACLALSQGAPLSSEVGLVDQMLDMFTAHILDMENFLESQGFTRNKRDVAGYKTYSFGGVQAGIKYKDDSNKVAGGEAFIQIDDVKSKFPGAHSSEIRVHVAFDGKASPADGIFDFEIDYHLTHADGDGVEEGQLDITRKKQGSNYITELKTSTKPFASKPIIPATISNADILLESDRQTFLKLTYVNPAKERNLVVSIKRDPMKKMEISVTSNGAVLLDQVIEVVSGALGSGNLGLTFAGEFSGKFNYNSQGIMLDLTRNGVKIAQVQTKVQRKAGATQAKIKVNTNSQLATVFLQSIGLPNKFEFDSQRTATSLKIKEGKLGYRIAIDWANNNRNFKIQKDGVDMINYQSTIIKNVNTKAEIDFEATSSLELSPNSKLYSFISTSSPLGGFLKRENHISFKLDKLNRNLLFRKFKIDVDMKKDGKDVLDFHVDTTGKPYTFKLKADRLRALLPVNRQAEGIEIVVDHDIGKSIKITSNGFGGLEFFASRASNAAGGIDFEAYTKKAGDEMMHYKLTTALTNDASKFLFKLNGDLKVNSESVLFKNIIANYKFLTPFNKRVGEIEIFVDKQNKNVIAPKFKIHAHVDKDGAEALEVLFDTTTSPYKITIHAPFLRNALGLSTKGIDITVNHQKGKFLEVVSNIPGFSGLKITTKGSTKELEFNGQKVGAGEFKSGPNSITIGASKAGDGKVIKYLKDGDNIQVTIKWAVPNSYNKNTINIDVKGSRRNLNMEVKYDFSQIDFNINTASKSSFDMKADGNNPTVGKYSVTRKGEMNAANGILSLDWSGTAKWEQGPAADKSPIITNMDLTYDSKAKDLVGSMSKSFNGRLYEITFPKGSGMGALPKFNFAG